MSKQVDPRTGAQWQCQGCGRFLEPERAWYGPAEDDFGVEPYCGKVCYAHAVGRERRELK